MKPDFSIIIPHIICIAFDQHCKKLEIREPVITKELYDKWSFRFDKESKTSQNNRLQALRGFSSYLNTMGIESYIPVTLPKPEKIVPYLMSDDDIREFFEQVDRYETDSPRAAFYRMSVEYKVLFRLIYCCGLRNNEACTLKTENVDLANGCMILYHTKGNKDRVVYLSDDLRILCQNYQSWMRKELGGRQSECFFRASIRSITLQKLQSTANLMNSGMLQKPQRYVIRNLQYTVCAMRLYKTAQSLDGKRHLSSGDDALSEQLSWS